MRTDDVGRAAVSTRTWCPDPPSVCCSRRSPRPAGRVEGPCGREPQTETADVRYGTVRWGEYVRGASVDREWTPGPFTDAPATSHTILSLQPCILMSNLFCCFRVGPSMEPHRGGCSTGARRVRGRRRCSRRAAWRGAQRRGGARRGVA